MRELGGRLARYSLALAAAALLASCSKPVVAIKKGYDFSRIKRVALIGFSDRPGLKGSGDARASAFQARLLEAGYDVIERRKVRGLLKEQSFQLSGAVDSRTARSVGKILGVDALLLGELNVYTAETSGTRLVDEWQETQEPIIRRERRRVQRGDVWVEEEYDEIVGHRTNRTKRRVPQDWSTLAQVGASIRLVDTETGELLWAASDSSSGVNLQDAADTLASRVLKAVRKAISAPTK